MALLLKVPQFHNKVCSRQRRLRLWSHVFLISEALCSMYNIQVYMYLVPTGVDNSIENQQFQGWFLTLFLTREYCVQCTYCANASINSCVSYQFYFHSSLQVFCSLTSVKILVFCIMDKINVKLVQVLKMLTWTLTFTHCSCAQKCGETKRQRCLKMRTTLLYLGSTDITIQVH